MSRYIQNKDYESLGAKAQDNQNKNYESLEAKAEAKIAPSKLEWLKSLKPGDVVASNYRTKGSFFLKETVKKMTIYSDSVSSAISCEFEDGLILDSFWIEPISAMENQ